MKKEILTPDFFIEPEGYTRIVKPYADGRTRRDRIDWCIANCKKEFTGTIADEVTYEEHISRGDRVQLLYFECEKEAAQFAFVN